MFLFYLLKSSIHWPQFDLQGSSAPIRNTPSKGSVWEVSIILAHLLLAAPLPHAAHTGQCPSPTDAVPALTGWDTFKLQPKLQTMAKNRQQQQSWKMPHHCPRQREEIRRLTKKSGVKTRIKLSIIFKVEGAAGFVRTQEPGRVCCFSAGQVRTPACFILCFNHKVMVVAVTVILAVRYRVVRCCSQAT